MTRELDSRHCRRSLRHARIRRHYRTQRPHQCTRLVDAPATIKNYGTARFRPIRIKVKYCKSDDEWRALSVEITGPLLKSDDTAGPTTSSEYYLDLGSLDAPEWLLAIVALYTPTVAQ